MFACVTFLFYFVLSRRKVLVVYELVGLLLDMSAKESTLMAVEGCVGCVNLHWVEFSMNRIKNHALGTQLKL